MRNFLFACSLLAAAAALSACAPSGPNLLDGSTPGCPATPSSLSGACATPGDQCVYSSAGCASYSYVCVASDGGTQGTWEPRLCE